MKTSFINHIRRLVIKIFGAFVLILICTAISYAQPGLPGNPSQAPIDGGLGILAAAGGAYALKKIREKNKPE